MNNANSAPEAHYDVIIIGGRPAGATLAARLGQQGVRVLLVERARFPSLPPVSSPIIYPVTMTLLDEIGADEAQYARNTPKIRAIATEARDVYRGMGRLQTYKGRDYAYALDRARFDDALWRQAASFPTVSALQDFSATDLLWDGDKVIGIMGKPSGEAMRPFYADVVVGADGRSSLVARKVKAAVYNERNEHPVTYYYAYWNKVAAYDLHEPMMITHGTLDGLGFLMMDSADDTVAVVVGGYTERFDIPHTDAQDLYLSVLQHAPRVWERLKNAEQVTAVHGLKNVPNYYRQPFGAGWALVGDAAHHKDPLGGQGIYDAVFGARAFAAEYLIWHNGDDSWEQAMTRYKNALEAETLEMYHNTVAGTSNYAPMNPIQMMLGRYAVEDPMLINHLLSIPSRAMPPSRAVNIPMVASALIKGVAGDVQRSVIGGRSPAHIPALPDKPETGSNDMRLGCLGWFMLIPFLLAANGLRGKRS